MHDGRLRLPRAEACRCLHCFRAWQARTSTRTAPPDITMPRASTIVAVLALFANAASVSAFTTSHSRWAGASVGARTATRSSDASVLAMVAGRGRSRPPGYKDPEPDSRSLGSKMFGNNQNIEPRARGGLVPASPRTSPLMPPPP